MRNPSRLQRVESSAVFVKSPYPTEIRLSEALGTKYNACMNTDALLSSCSYQPSPCKSSALVRTRTPKETRKFRSGLAILMAGYGLNSMILACRALERYVDGDEFSYSLSSFLAFLFAHTANVKNLFRRDDALRATVYFNIEDENWVKSLVRRNVEVSIKWVAIVLCQGLASILFLYIAIFDKCEPDTRVKDAERADVLKFDVAKVVQLFANDIGNSSTYCHFIITEPEGAIVYGRLRAKGFPSMFD
ncbi:hypothetical protein V1508DRAFT_406892 [Lipomyces doorenjongii]|uniref:uncharacterized protein n=1 Tax=Lipomyces doorenjongii TaxID=383834 RepID=UPI0034CDB2FD